MTSIQNNYMIKAEISKTSDILSWKPATGHKEEEKVDTRMK